ncbi:MAG: glycine betaine ABC transporter substrate-binding protein [Acidobacteriota bacterium]
MAEPIRARFLALLLTAAAAVAAVMLQAGALAAQDAPATIVVGSKSFTESRVLGEILAQRIEAVGGARVAVERRANLGGTMIVFRALEAGDIDLYAEYSGTAWATILGETAPARDPLRTYLEVQRRLAAQHDLAWRLPLGFSNTYAIAVREAVAARLNLTRISDLAARGGDLRSGWSHEFLEREDGYPGLAAAYGLDLAEVRGMEHGLAYEALRSGRIDVTDAYSTDGKLQRFPVRVLEDDRGFFPPYDCAPVVRQATLDAHPWLGPALDALAYRLSATRMQQLNDAVESGGRSARDVARDFLAAEGLLGDGAADGRAREATAGDSDRRRDAPLLAFARSRLAPTLGLTAQHLLLTGVAVVLAVLVAVPLGVLLTRRRALAGPVLQFAGVLQTVPSLALLAFMIPVLGLGAPAAIAALFLYALLPIVRNTTTGIDGVDPALRDAAIGMGLRDRERLMRVELPLALPTIMAGIRTATVISIGVATLAAFIGAGGLGDPIVTGLQLNDTRLILSGALPAALLAIVADALLGRLEAWLDPQR